jgi:hypothetical protein
MDIWLVVRGSSGCLLLWTIRIIESGLVIKAMEVVLAANDKKVGCDESKNNAQYLLDKINKREIILPVF